MTFTVIVLPPGNFFSQPGGALALETHRPQVAVARSDAGEGEACVCLVGDAEDPLAHSWARAIAEALSAAR